MAVTPLLLNVDIPGTQGQILPQNRMTPVSAQCDWFVCHTGLTTADNGGSSVIAPGGITRAACYKVSGCGFGTLLQLAVQYARAVTISTATVIGVWGFDRNGVWQKCYNAATTPAHELTFDDASSTDADDGTTWKTTDWQEVDLNGNHGFLIAVKTALALSSGTSAQLIARLK